MLLEMPSTFDKNDGSLAARGSWVPLTLLDKNVS